jgi:signal transduction histidine kinase
MKHERRTQELIHASAVAIEARWFYGIIALLFAIVGETSRVSDMGYVTVFILILAYMLSNFWFSSVLEGIVHKKRDAAFLPVLNATQVILDLFYIFALIYIAGTSFLAVAYVLYFIPIILSLVFFEFSTTIIVALTAGVSIFVMRIFILGSDFAQSTLSFPPPIEVGVITVMYLLASFFGASIMKKIRSRERLLHEKMHREEEHIRELSVLAQEFDRSAKLLVRRDLDLTKAHRELERIDQMKSEIISVVAHQLRTPLSAVKWTLKMLTDGDAGSVTNEQKTMMMKAYESNERMISLVNDMLSADRMESGKFRYRFFPIQLEDLIENVVTEILSKANDRGVGVRFLRPAQNLPRVTMDPDKIREVLQNLIDNAIKYSRRGGTVTIGIQKEVGSVLVSVADQGIGIPKTEQEKIFGRFFRAQNALRVETDGSGLGLFIVRGIIQRHGGDVSFESEEGKGTTMRVRLPLDPLAKSAPTK